MTNLLNEANLYIHPAYTSNLWNEKSANSKVLTYSFYDDTQYSIAPALNPSNYTASIFTTEQKTAFKNIVENLSDISAPASFEDYRVSYADVLGNITFTEISHTGTQNNQYGDILVGSATLPFGDDGKTLHIPDLNDGSETLDKSRIFINDSFQSSDYELGKNGYFTIMHEFAHSMGLRDTASVTGLEGEYFDNQKYSVMSYNLFAELNATQGVTSINPSSLQLLDIASLQERWGRRNYETRGTDDISTININEADTTYLLNPSLGQLSAVDILTPFMYTIWDGAGIDTLDASSYNGIVDNNSTELSVELDLRQGHFSSVGVDSDLVKVIGDNINNPNPNNPDPGNVAIAYYTVIENAFGTNFDDILIGNAWNNRLEGGAGNDIIYGDGFVYDGDIGERLWESASGSVKYDDNGSGDDTLIGGAGSDILNGGAGQDTVSYAGDPVANDGTGVSVTLGWFNGNGTAIDGFGDTDTLQAIENIIGSAGDDTFTFTGTVAMDNRVLDGGAGNDTLVYDDYLSFYRVINDLNGNRIADATAQNVADTYTNIENIQLKYYTDLIPEYNQDLTATNFADNYNNIYYSAFRDSINITGNTITLANGKTHSGFSSYAEIYGTNNGDVININSSTPRFISGTGDDIINYDSNAYWSDYTYRGGIDTVNATSGVMLYSGLRVTLDVNYVFSNVSYRPNDITFTPFNIDEGFDGTGLQGIGYGNYQKFDLQIDFGTSGRDQLYLKGVEILQTIGSNPETSLTLGNIENGNDVTITINNVVANDNQVGFAKLALVAA